MVATNWGGTKQKQITKNNRFEKQQISKFHILENNTFQKQQQMKKKQQISINDKSQKTSNIKKQQISKNNKFQKIGMIKSFLEFVVVIVMCFFFKSVFILKSVVC